MKAPAIRRLFDTLNYLVILATIFSFVLLFIPTINKIYVILAILLGAIIIYTLAAFKDLKDSVKDNTENIKKLEDKIETSEKIAEINAKLKFLEKKLK